MKRNVFGYLLIILFFVLIASCSKDDSQKRIEYAKIVESRTTRDLLNDLYVGSDADVEAIARIMNVTPSSIERIRNGETDPTDQFEERINEVSIYYMQNDQSFSKLRSVVDPEYGWYDAVLDIPSLHPYWFWIGNVMLIVILPFIAGWYDLGNVIKTLIWLTVGEILVFFVAWIASLICSPDAIQDNYVDSINPTIEQVK